MPQNKQLTQFQSLTFSGPLPPPQLLSQYNDVVPNGAERLMKMAEAQQAHRQDLEKTVVHGNVESEKRGQWMGLSISLVVIAAGTYLAATGHAITGGVFVGVDVVALASVFVFGKHVQRRELDKKKTPSSASDHVGHLQPNSSPLLTVGKPGLRYLIKTPVPGLVVFSLQGV